LSFFTFTCGKRRQVKRGNEEEEEERKYVEHEPLKLVDLLGRHWWIPITINVISIISVQFSFTSPSFLVTTSTIPR